MAEIDPVILQLRADVDKYITDLRQTTTKVDDLLGRQEKQVGRSKISFGNRVTQSRVT
jgi:hypothetical protein